MILDDIENLLRKCVILKSDAHYVAETMWIAHTYAVECFDFTPRLAIWSPEKRCGKSLNLEIVSNLVSNSRVTSSISSSALFRMISKSESTVFLIDESDRVFGGKGDKEKAEALTQIINTRDAFHAFSCHSEPALEAILNSERHASRARE